MIESRRALPLLLLLSASIASTAAAQDKHAPAAADPYSKELAVLDRVERIYTYNADGTGTRDVTVVADVRTDAAVKGWSIVSLPFASGIEHVVVDYVRVRRPDGTVIATPASDAQEQPEPVTREAPFYSDLKDIQVPVRSLRAGDHVEYHFHVIRTRAEAPGHFWGAEDFVTFASGVVVRSEVVEVRVPKDAYIQTWSPKHPATTTDSATEHVTRWESKQTKPVAGVKKEDLLRGDPSLLDTDANGDRLPAVAWSNFHTWAEVGAWYRSMEGARMDPDDEIRARTRELTAGKSTPEAQARAVYGFVGPQVRYIGVAFGIGRYQPHEAADVLRNQYGDCKDKHTLQAAMLSAAGISSDAVLIGAGIAFNEALPTPAAFNHLITLAHIDGHPVWLDATAEVAPFRMLMSPLRGKRALVVPATGEAHLETTPEALPFPFEDRFNATGTLDDKGTTHSQITLDLRGDTELPFRQAARSVTPAQWDELMQQISYSMSFAGKVSNAQFSRADDTSAPFHVTYDYEREKAGDWDNLRILPQLPPNSFSDADEKDPPVRPIQLNSPHVELSHTVMKLPAGWGVELPAPVHAKSAFATLDKTYKFEGGAVIVDRRIEVLKSTVPAAQWREYHSWYKAAGLDGETYIQLTRTGGKRAAAVYNEEAASLIDQAVQLEKEKSWDAATAKLDQVKAINPHQAFLWSNYAFIAEQYGILNEAADDAKREIADHPEEEQPYRLLAYVQIRQRKPDDALKTLGKLLKLQPSDEYAARVSAELLIGRKDYTGAISELRSAIADGPTHDRLKLQLSHALMHEGKRDDARALLVSLATDSTDPGLLNDSAYELANESLDLPVAYTASQHSLTLLEDAILSRAGSPQDALNRASLLVSLWDTIGWVFFRQDKLKEAEPYLRAAWRNGQAAEVGLHMGELLEKQGKPADALAQYRLAADVAGSGTTAEIKKTLEEKIAALKDQAPRHTAEQLLTMRSYEVPRPATVPDSMATLTFEVDPDGSISHMESVNVMANADAAVSGVKGLKLDLQLPPGTRAPLLRMANLNCRNSKTCDVVLITPREAVVTAR